MFSNKELRINDENIKALLLKYFFSSFNEEKIYCFSHETDIKFNEIYSYSKELFERNTSFVDISINISKLLYESSNHPNIKNGELYIAYIRNCILDGNYYNAIGIFKSENKDTYLKIEEQPIISG